MSKDLCARYYQKTKKTFQKSLMKVFQNRENHSRMAAFQNISQSVNIL